MCFVGQEQTLEHRNPNFTMRCLSLSDRCQVAHGHRQTQASAGHSEPGPGVTLCTVWGSRFEGAVSPAVQGTDRQHNSMHSLPETFSGFSFPWKNPHALPCPSRLWLTGLDLPL